MEAATSVVRGIVCGTLEHRNLECCQGRTDDEVMTHNEQICARFVGQMRHGKNRQHSDGVWTIGRLFYLVSQTIIKQGGSVHDMEREIGSRLSSGREPVRQYRRYTFAKLTCFHGTSLSTTVNERNPGEKAHPARCFDITEQHQHCDAR